jgi:GT2 family glycosyltransferase
LIRRAVIDQIGLLDERFIGYGWEDVDFCRRAVTAGWNIACTGDAVVKHGHKETPYSSSFIRNADQREYERKILVGRAIYQQKWGDVKFEKFK